MDVPRHGQRLAFLALLAHLVAGATVLLAEPKGEEVLTLERAMALAEAGNWHLRALTARTEAAQAAVDGQRAERLPRLDATTGFLRTDNPVAVFGNLLLQERFGAENFDLDRLNQPAPLNDWLARLEATVPLWTGGRNKHALAAAEHRLVGGEFLHARARHEVMAEVVARYGDAVVSIHGHDAARQALQTAEAHVALARDRVETGIAVASDLLMAEVRASAAHEAVVRAENAVNLSRAALNLVLGRDLDTPFGLPDAFAIQPAGPADSLAQRAERAKAQRPDLAAARSHRNALTSEGEAVGASRRPRLDLSVGTETHAEDPTDSAGQNTSVGLRFAIPLFDGGRTRARKRGAEARIREAEAELARFEDRIAFEVRAAFLARASAEERLRLANAAVKLALAGLTIVEDRYREGLTTLAELLDSQVALADARVRQVAGQRDLVLAGAQLALASGDLPMEP